MMEQKNIYIQERSSLHKLGFQYYHSQNIEHGLVSLPAFAGIRINYIFKGKSVAEDILKAGDLMIAGFTDYPLYGNVYDFSMASIGIHFSLLYYLTGILPKHCRMPYKVPKESELYSNLIPFFELPIESWNTYALTLTEKIKPTLNNTIIRQLERITLATEVYKLNQTKNMQYISKEIGISYRQLQRDFCSFLGMTPSEFERLSRYQRAATKVKNDTIINAAISTGYYDQAHMIKDFKKFANKTPKQLSLIKDITIPFVDEEII